MFVHKRRSSILPLLVCAVATMCASAQAPLAAPGPAQSVESAATTGATTDGSAISTTGGKSSLPAGQIIGILQEKPEIVIELKSLLADQLTQQGVPTQPDAITDEALYSQIATSSDVRDKVTTFLRARGYISNADLQRAASGDRSDNEDDDPVSVQTIDTLSQLPGADFSSGANGTASRSALLQAGAVPGSLSGSSLPPGSYPRMGTTNPYVQTRTPMATREPNNVTGPNLTDPPPALHLPAPYNLLAMRDLYTQVPEESGALKRFGSDVFLRRSTAGQNLSASALQEASLDIPLGPDYVVGPGDSLTIDMWGGISQTLTRTIDREGSISLPEAGSIQIAGMTLDRAQNAVINTLKRQYRDVQVAVTIARLRSVRVYVVGDVQRPGAYELNSLSSPLNALYAAGGPTSVGSLRTLRHYRGSQLIAEVDLYDFLLHGVKSSDNRFQGGDTLLVPPSGPLVAVSGAVKRPAIYEVRGNTNLATLLDDAGGATADAALTHITVERIDAHQHRETITVDAPSDASATAIQAALTGFLVKDGDRIHLAPVLPYSEHAVYLEGHVVRPGRMPYRDGMKLNDVIRSYQDLLPEPADKAELIRLVAPDLHAETIEFSISDALIGNYNIELLPFDTVRVRGRYDLDAPKVTVRGEVLRPGSYPLSLGMTAAQLVRMAGGFKRDALLTDADLTSYDILDGSKAVGQRTAIRIGDALRDKSADANLKAGDVLTIHQITGWNDIGASVSIEGEVGHSGSYGIQQGERLSSVLRRAGGFRDTAYPMGAVLVREQVRELEEKSRQELIRQIETSSAAARLSPNLGGGDSGATLQLVQQQQEQALSRLRSQPASGRLVIRISADIESWANTTADVEMRSGDVLTIPKRPGFVLVSGQVYNSSAITFVPGRTAGWYLRRAGGANDVANRKEIFVIRANGAVVGRHSGEWYDGNVLSTQLDAGDVVVVPQRILGASLFWRNLLTTAQIASSIAITAAVAGL